MCFIWILQQLECVLEEGQQQEYFYVFSQHNKNCQLTFVGFSNIIQRKELGVIWSLDPKHT